MESLVITLESISVFGAGALSFIVGFLVYVRDRSRKDNFSFLLLSLSIGGWSLFLALFESVVGDMAERVILTLLYVFSALIPLSLLFFSLFLSTDKDKKIKKNKIVFLGIPCFLIIVAILIPGYVLKDIQIGVGWAKEITFGPGVFLFNLYIVLYTLYALYILLKKYLKSAGVFKTESGYVLLSIFIAILFALFANLILPTFGVYYLSWIGPIVAALTLGSIGFLLVRYNFWNIKLVATEFFVSLISLILLLEIFLSRSLSDFIIKLIIFILVVFSSFFLVRSVKHEIESREEMEKLASELTSVNKDLQELDRQKSEFVANSAHHLRDPLTAIKGYASMALEGSFGSISKESKEAISRISQSSERLVVIIEDFMDISQIESGEMDYAFSKVDLKNMMHDIVEEMKPAASDSGLEIGLGVDEAENYYSKIDEGKIRQVVSNLLDNAIKYTPHGTVGISLTKEKPGKILLSVFDTGIGMKPDTISKIFHKFSRADEASKFHTGGSGLGLYVASEILKKHDGRIWAESPGLGKGSVFHLELNEV